MKTDNNPIGIYNSYITLLLDSILFIYIYIFIYICRAKRNHLSTLSVTLTDTLSVNKPIAHAITTGGAYVSAA